MFSKFKIEILIGSLLLATFAIILANSIIVRSYEMTPLNVGGIGVVDDRELGGTSEAFAEIAGGAFNFNYRVDETTVGKKYALISIIPNDDFQGDLSWVDRFQIKIKSNRHEGEKITFYIKDFQRGVSVEDDVTSIKYNETVLSLTDKLETINVNRDDFLVPTWWQLKYNVKGKAAKPTFKDVRSFQFNANTSGESEIEIASIRCIGNWFDGAMLNQTLLWIWMGGMLIGIIYRMLNLTKKLNDQVVSASQLQAHNNVLQSESAIYHELARRDPLTGLFNRYGLETELEVLSSKYNFDYTMLLFDLDKFKEINDSLGHSYGDRVLFDIATIVRSKLGEKDIVARWGGDEFLVILHERNAKQAADVAEEIRQSFLASDLAYSCSFGICKSEIDKSFESIFSNADAALYESKNSGRNKISSFREKGGRRAGDNDEPVVPEITLLPNDLPTGEFMIYE